MSGTTLGRRAGLLALGAAVVATLAVVHPGGRWLQPVPAGLLAGWAGVAAVLERRRPGPAPAGRELLLLAGLAVYLGSSAVTDPHFAWPRWADPMALRWAGLAAGLALLCRWRPTLRRWLVPGLAAGFAAWAAVALWRETGGAAVYNDDHPSFMLRLSVLARSLPRWIPYNPFWNGGGATTYEAASGSLGPALLLWPLWRWFPVLDVYTPGLALLFLAWVPLLAALSVRSAGGGAVATGAGALLALGPGWMLFRWALEFGAIGACLAMACLLPVAALLARLVAGRPFGPGAAAALVAASLGFLAWPGSWPMSLALLPALAVTLPRWNRGTTLRVAACGALVLLAIAPLAASLLARTDIGAFTTGGGLEPAPAGWGEGVRRLGSAFRETNPLLLWLGVLGATVFSPPPDRRFLGTLVAALVVLAGWGEYLGGGPGMSRTGLALAFVAVLPAALAVERLGRRPALAGALLGLLAVSGYSTVRFYANRTAADYHPVRTDLLDLARWLQDNTPDQARILFGGHTVHAYGGGHVAALPLLAGREMIAADYYHFSPRLVEYFCPPRAFRQTDADVHRYLTLYNVSHVIAYDVPSVVRFYRKYPDLYEEVKTFDGPLPKTVFRVRDARASFFRLNQGRVEASVNRLRVSVEDPAAEAVIAYHFAEGLEATPPAEVYPVEQDGRQWIGIRPNGRAEVDIRYRGWW